MLTEENVGQAVEFHGHLGPFLVIGVRMGLVGLEKLDAQPKDGHLSVVALQPLRVPFSCVIDGLQVVTRCTVGNQKLTVKDSDKIQAEFRRSGEKTIVTLKDSVCEKLKAQLSQGGMTDENVCALARKIAVLPECELFTVRQQRLRK